MGKVIIGIIDDGIAFAHERFRNAAGTRVEYLWVQDGSGLPPGAPFDYGSELDSGAINALIGNCAHAGFVNEDLLYAMAGVADFRAEGHKPIASRAAHGTHVMDLACGYDLQQNQTERPIVCVQLPRAVAANPQVIGNSHYPIDGMRYILRCADIIAGREGKPYLPVVINFSFGSRVGPHDGTSHFEDEIDDIVNARINAFGQLALEVVLPAGNAHVSRCHAEVSFPNIGDVVPLKWRVLPDDRTPSFLEVWLPFRSAAAPPSRLRLRITPPGGPTSAWIGETGTSSIEWPPVNPVARVIFSQDPLPTDRSRFAVQINQTASLDSSARLAPAGTWRIDLENRGLAPYEVVHAWIERDEPLNGYRLGGRQSYFDNECYERFDDGGREIETDQPGCVIKRAGTISAIATGRNPIVLGGILRKDMVAAKYSAGGPITGPLGAPADPDRPDAVTVSEDSRVHRGVLAAGSRSGSVVAMGGTSVAAPQITRWIADQLALGYPADRPIVQNLAWWQELAASFGILPPRPTIHPPLPNPRYGNGRIELPPPFVGAPPPSILDPLVPRPRLVER